MKKLSLITLILLVLFSLNGCSSSKIPRGLIDLGNREKVWLEELKPIHEDVVNKYSSWERGEITREQFQDSLKKHIPALNNLRKEYIEYSNANPLSEEDKNNILYIDGLVYFDKMRTKINNFIFLIIVGNPSTVKKTAEGEPAMEQSSDSNIKEKYNLWIKTQYQDYLNKLEKAIADTNKK